MIYNIHKEFISDILPYEFLEQYITKTPPWGFNGLGYVIFKRTYARELPWAPWEPFLSLSKEMGETLEEQQKNYNQDIKLKNKPVEEWWQTIARCINGAQKIGAKYTKEEAQKLYDLIFNLKCSFGGRMLWQLGTKTVDRFGANSLINCLAGETKVLTRQGWKEIKDLAGTKQTIVTKNGKWTEAEFKSYGKQHLYKVTFRYLKGKSQRITIKATQNHRWLVIDTHDYDNSHEGTNYKEVLTSDLKIGNHVPVVRGKNSSKSLSPQGIQHGLVFGDGTCNNYNSSIDLINDTYKYCNKYFSLNEHYNINNNENHVRYVGMPNYYKQFPNINENKSYLSGFLSGWIAADGNVSKNGQVRLFNKSKDVLMKAIDIASVLGYRINGSPKLMRNYNPFDKNKPSELWYINFSKNDNLEKIIIREDHLEKYINSLKDKKYHYNNIMIVESVEPTTDFEEVYCAEVPETKCFVIDGNILTGNCYYISMNTIDSFCFVFENLMLGGGVGFSIRREDIHELPRVKKGVVIKHQETKDADFIVPDSREGWVKFLRNVLEAYFNTGKGFTYSTIVIRGYGEPIKGFGGKASGPQSLIDGIEKICVILKNREGKKLRSVDVLDINNIIADIVISGNTRRCLPEYSMVHTKSGLNEIKNVCVGDDVLTTKGYKKVVNKFYQGLQKTIKILTQDGEFECTPNHKMAVLNSIKEYSWKQAIDLVPGDRLISVDTYEETYNSGNSMEYIPVEVISVVDGNSSVETYDIEVEDVHEFFADGYLTHNSAEIALGDPDDFLFLRAKRWDLGKIPNWRSNSNNTIYADSYDHISDNLWEGYNGNGEPYGLFNLPLCQKMARLGHYKNDYCIGVNPCLAGDTIIETQQGEMTLKNIIESPEPIQVLGYNFDTSEKIYDTVTERGLTKKSANLIKINLKDGSSIKLTPDHLVYVSNKSWIKASDITKGDKILKFKKT